MKKIVYLCRNLPAMVCRDTGLDIKNASDRSTIEAIALTVAKVVRVFALHYHDLHLSEQLSEPYPYPATVYLKNGDFLSVKIFIINSPSEIRVVNLEVSENNPDRIDDD